MNKLKWTRRQFLKSAAVTAGVFTIVPAHVLGRNGQTPPSEQLNRALIGVGGMGRNHLKYDGARTVAICDVDAKHLENGLKLAQEQGDEPKTYGDFRRMLEQEDIDVVHIATPPHWHGLMSIAAAEAGKDVWCEKPMTRTIAEGQAVRDAVQRNGRIFRVNTWFRFMRDYYGMNIPTKPIKKVAMSGMLGWPLKITLGANTGFNWKFFWSGRTYLKPQQVPGELDYNMWLGPAPEKPYHEHRVHSSFRGYWDYDGGGLGDMGQHYLDPAQWILDKDHTSPVLIEADAPQQHPDAAGSWRRIYMRYEDGCEIVLDGVGDDESVPFMEGPNGRIYKGFESDIPNLRRIVDGLPDPEPQENDFYDCVRTRRKFCLNEENGHRSCTLVNLGVIAVRLGRPLHFDPKTQRFVNDEEANRLVCQPMRAPWRV